MQDVARAAGVHQTTVSMALRHHPRLPLSTAERIRSLATELGYRPNPLVSALIAGRKRRGQELMATLGYVIGDSDPRDARRTESAYRDLLQGVRGRAEELGFGLDILRLGDPEISSQRFHEIAKARAIHGLIIAPLTRREQTLDIRWNQFASVAYGYSMAQPRLHRICPDFYHSVLEVMDRSRAAGRSRIGLVLDRSTDAKSDHLWLSAFMADQMIEPPRHGRPVPTLLVDRHTLAGAEAWFGRHQPQSVVALPDLLTRLRGIWRGLRQVPEPAWISLDTDRPGNPRGFPGVVLDRSAAGAACVDVVTSMLYRNERGLPEVPQNILLETKWAGTVPPLPAAKSGRRQAHARTTTRPTVPR